MRSGVRLALDLGEARIGVAACDPAGTLAFPVATVRAGPGETAELARLVAAYEPIEILVGLPRSLSGADGPAAVTIRARAQALAGALHPVPVRLVDERLSTVAAARQLRAAGRSAKQQRSRIDAAAAAAILEHALTSEKTLGRAPGELVSAGPPADP